MLAVQGDIVRGPERSTRLGRCLIITPTLATARPNQFPSQALIVTTAARRMIELSKAGEKLKSIVVSGDKDPIQHPEFRDISENLRELTKKWFPKAQLCLLSDSLFLEDPEVRIALGIYDKPILRLEAGTQKTFRALSGEKGETFKEVIANLNLIENERIILQARFVKGGVDNTTDAELRSWMKYVADIGPASVQIYTIPKADPKSKLKPVTPKALEAIATNLHEKTGITCEVCSE